MSRFLVVDEYMSAWRGQDGKYSADELPQVTKPEGVGAELKLVCCGQSGVLLHLDIMDWKDRQNETLFEHEFGAGTAVTLQLTHSNWTYCYSR